MSKAHPGADRSKARLRAKTRLDQALVDRELCPSREKAKRAVMAGQVKVNGNVMTKAGALVELQDCVTVAAPERFVSRGGYKLDHALDHFRVEVAGLRALDIGASTGGFTDCLLQRQAAQVYAIDVGQGQLAWKLRRDPRVVVMEKVNARELEPRMFPGHFSAADLAVIDCSFISLRLVLPPVVALLRPSAKLIALIKPQFEAGKADVDRGAGVIRDPEIHQRVVDELHGFVNRQPGLRWVAVCQSPVLGPAGNKEFLALIEKLS